MISMIAAMSKNRVIGKDNKLPWHIPEDLSWFKSQTINKTILMGRKTYESLGKPLKNRNNLVLTKNINYSAAEGVKIYGDIDSVLKENKELFIIGGQQIYELFLPYANKIYLTVIESEIDGDSFFPQLTENDWKYTYTKNGSDNTTFKYSFNILDKNGT